MSKNIIFVTVGSQKFQFNRLIKCLDKLVFEGKIKGNVFAQIGYSTYYPKFLTYKKFLNRSDFQKLESIADIIITHGGTGAIVGAVKKGKKVIGVPRLKKYGEHVDDHQIQILQEFKKLNLIEVCYDLNHLVEAIDKVQKHHFNKYISNTTTIINSINDYIEQSYKRSLKK